MVENSGREITCCMILNGCLNLTETPQLLLCKIAFSYQHWRVIAMQRFSVWLVLAIQGDFGMSEVIFSGCSNGESVAFGGVERFRNFGHFTCT